MTIMMMLNLFSIFDPKTSMMFSLNWFSLMIPLILMPNTYWLINSKFYLFIMKIYFYLLNEFKMLKLKNYTNLLIFISLFTSLGIMNFMGLFPYIFTPTSHILITLPLALTLWLSIILFNLFNNFTKFMAHLLPQGTPSFLMSFMILIESISNLIRPGALAIRLAANMIAGHLLLCLLGNMGPNLYLIQLMFFIPIELILLILESAVALIQSYVFITLLSLYSNEI